MLKIVVKTSTLLLAVCVLLSCANVDQIGPPQDETRTAITAVLKQWCTGYETEDIDAYMSTFWVEGFRYYSDMGTPDDPSDFVEFDDIREEKDSTIRVFAQFQDIEIELSDPPEITLNSERNRAEVRNHYRIQGFVADGESLEGGFTGWFAEGDNLFVFELRNAEWRIIGWIDEAYSNEKINLAAFPTDCFRPANPSKQGSRVIA